MARELRIVVTADTAQADRALTGTEKSVQGVTKATGDLDKQMANATGSLSRAELAAIGLTAAFAIEKIVGFAREVGRFAGEMSDLSARTGIGVERLQALNLVGVDVGISVEQMADAIAQLSRRLVGEDPGAVKALEQLGLKAKELIALSPDEQLFAIAEAISQIPNPTERSAVAMELLGRSGAKMLPLLTDGFKELTLAAERSGGVMSKEIIDKADAFDDFFNRSWIQVRALSATMAGEFVDALSSVKMGQDDVAISAREMTQALALTDDGLAGATANAEKNLKKLGVETMPSVAVSMDEAGRISRQLTADVQESIRVRAAEVKAVERSEAAYRQYTNFIEERYIETIKLSIEVGEKQREELNKLSTAMGTYLGDLQKQNEATQASLDAQDAAWRQHRNMVGELLMEQDRQTMSTTQTMGQYFGDLFSNIGEGVDSLMGMLGEALGPRMGRIIGQFQDAWRAGRQVWSGILRGMAGDFSGWMDAIMGGIALIRSAFNGLKGLFGGGEEGTVVNPARDTFLSQWGNPSDKGVGGAGWNLASILTGLGAGEGGGPIFAALQRADTMALFRPAAQAIVEFLTSHGEQASMNFAVGGMVPRDGLAMVHRDEAVLTPRGVAAVGGAGAVAALNQGSGDSALARKFDDLSSTLTMLLQTLPTAFGHEMQLRLAHRTRG